MGRKLILADGTIIDEGEAGLSGGFLWLYFSNWTMSRIAKVFTNPDKTQIIRFQYGEMEDVFAGYTDCVSMSKDTDGQISVCMVKG